ncbi:MAG: McrC family protein, partial [Armatimonadota bacterium]
MTSDLRLQELEQQYVSLTPDEAQYLLARHHAHVGLRRAGEDGDAWLLAARQFCGTIALPGGRQLAIEPKARVGDLWSLLARAPELAIVLPHPAHGGSIAAEPAGVAAVFVTEAERLLKRGLARGYREHRESLSSPRGRLLLGEHLRVSAGRPQRFACEFAELSRDTPQNRLLAGGLEVADDVAGHLSHLRAGIWALRRALRGVEPARRPTARRLRPGPAREHYRVPLALAEMLLASAGLAPTPGPREVPALLVAMPQLFERFVRRTLADGLGEDLTPRSTGHSVALDSDGRTLLTPDLVLQRGARPVAVVDAKYKMLPAVASPGAPGPADLYQMLAYCVG